MSKMNAYLLQENIRLRGYVTVPWLQTEYKLKYGDARNIVELMVQRGWIAPEAIGIKYFVLKENLNLRKLRREEVGGLVADVTTDSSAALLCIKNADGAGATLSEIESAVQGEDDTQAALKILHEHNLISFSNDRYFSNVSRETIDIIADVAQEKNPGPFRKMFTERNDNYEHLKKRFDVLFDD